MDVMFFIINQPWESFFLCAAEPGLLKRRRYLPSFRLVFVQSFDCGALTALGRGRSSDEEEGMR
ncbi:MAG: hypothetical protein HOW97_38525 [Catenulispora sp.]|nr:hypothetical protein [Catenulispora sp.]